MDIKTRPAKIEVNIKDLLQHDFRVSQRFGVQAPRTVVLDSLYTTCNLAGIISGDVWARGYVVKRDGTLGKTVAAAVLLHSEDLPVWLRSEIAWAVGQQVTLVVLDATTVGR